jgi:hypothetical protein
MDSVEEGKPCGLACWLWTRCIVSMDCGEWAL